MVSNPLREDLTPAQTVRWVCALVPTVLLIVVILNAVFGGDKHYTVEDLRSFYAERKDEIHEFKDVLQAAHSDGRFPGGGFNRGILANWVERGDVEPAFLETIDELGAAGVRVFANGECWITMCVHGLISAGSVDGFAWFPEEPAPSSFPRGPAVEDLGGGWYIVQDIY